MRFCLIRTKHRIPKILFCSLVRQTIKKETKHNTKWLNISIIISKLVDACSYKLKRTYLSEAQTSNFVSLTSSTVLVD